MPTSPRREGPRFTLPLPEKKGNKKHASTKDSTSTSCASTCSPTPSRSCTPSPVNSPSSSTLSSPERYRSDIIPCVESSDTDCTVPLSMYPEAGHRPMGFLAYANVAEASSPPDTPCPPPAGSSKASKNTRTKSPKTFLRGLQFKTPRDRADKGEKGHKDEKGERDGHKATTSASPPAAKTGWVIKKGKKGCGSGASLTPTSTTTSSSPEISRQRTRTVLTSSSAVTKPSPHVLKKARSCDGPDENGLLKATPPKTEDGLHGPKGFLEMLSTAEANVLEHNMSMSRAQGFLVHTDEVKFEALLHLKQHGSRMSPAERAIISDELLRTSSERETVSASGAVNIEKPAPPVGRVVNRKRGAHDPFICPVKHDQPVKLMSSEDIGRTSQTLPTNLAGRRTSKSSLEWPVYTHAAFPSPISSSCSSYVTSLSSSSAVQTSREKKVFPASNSHWHGVLEGARAPPLTRSKSLPSHVSTCAWLDMVNNVAEQFAFRTSAEQSAMLSFEAHGAHMPHTTLSALMKNAFAEHQERLMYAMLLCGLTLLDAMDAVLPFIFYHFVVGLHSLRQRLAQSTPSPSRHSPAADVASPQGLLEYAPLFDNHQHQHQQQPQQPFKKTKSTGGVVPESKLHRSSGGGGGGGAGVLKLTRKLSAELPGVLRKCSDGAKDFVQAAGDTPKEWRSCDKRVSGDAKPIMDGSLRQSDGLESPQASWSPTKPDSRGDGSLGRLGTEWEEAKSVRASSRSESQLFPFFQAWERCNSSSGGGGGGSTGSPSLRKTGDLQRCAVALQRDLTCLLDERAALADVRGHAASKSFWVMTANSVSVDVWDSLELMLHVLRLVSFLEDWLELYGTHPATYADNRALLKTKMKELLSMSRLSGLDMAVNYMVTLVDDYSYINLPCSLLETIDVRSGALLMDIFVQPTKQVANAITVILWRRYRRIHWLDLLWSSKYPGDAHAPYNSVVRIFNNLCGWVISCVLWSASNRTCASVLARFIDIARHLYHLKNFMGLAAVLTGLQDISVKRLKVGWKGISRNKRLLYDELKSVFLYDNNYSNYHAMISSMQDGPHMLFLAVITKDLSVIHNSKPFTGKMFTERSPLSTSILASTARICSRFLMSQAEDFPVLEVDDAFVAAAQFLLLAPEAVAITSSRNFNLEALLPRLGSTVLHTDDCYRISSRLCPHKDAPTTPRAGCQQSSPLPNRAINKSLSQRLIKVVNKTFTNQSQHPSSLAALQQADSTSRQGLTTLLLAIEDSRARMEGTYELMDAAKCVETELLAHLRAEVQELDLHSEGTEDEGGGARRQQQVVRADKRERWRELGVLARVYVRLLEHGCVMMDDTKASLHSN